MPAHLNLNGGLTLVPMPGHEASAIKLKETIEALSKEPDRTQTAVDIALPEFGNRASGEPFLRLDKKHVGGHDCVILTSGPGTEKMAFWLLLLVSYLAGRHARRIAVVSGYFPLGRSDKDEGSLEFALPSILIDLLQAAVGNDVPLKYVISVDLHSPQLTMAGPKGLIVGLSMVRRLLMRATLAAHRMGDNLCLVLPDDGAAKRVEASFDEVETRLGFKLPVVFGAKRRISSRECQVEKLFGDLDALRDSTAIVLDDEAATGGTNIATAAKLKTEYGARRVWAAFTHAVLCGEAPQRFCAPDCPVDRIFVTDTIPLQNRPELADLLASGRVEVISWLSDLARVIYYHHWDEAIRGVR